MRTLNDRVQECRDTWPPSGRPSRRSSGMSTPTGRSGSTTSASTARSRAGLDETNPVDRAHADFARECKEPGWQILQPELLLAPEPVISAMAQWAGSGHASEQE